MKIIISGGGTGGHIFPAIAIANEIKKQVPTCNILFVGANGRMEMDKVPQAGYPIIGLDVVGFQRRLTCKNLAFPFKLWKSLHKAKSIIKDFKPDLVIGVGGYASGPTLKMAVKAKIPTLIQEQNSYAGLTNKLLAKKVNTICVAYPKMDQFFPKDKIVYTGNPIRHDIALLNANKDNARRYFNLNDQQRPCLLIVGGSLGARTINETILNNVQALLDAGFDIIWQCGKTFDTQRLSMDLEVKSRVKLLKFIDRMDLAYAIADIIVSRAGAISISELCTVAKPLVLVPSPNVAEDHQTKNARVLVDRNAAIMVSDKECMSQLTQSVIDLHKDTEKCHEMSQQLKEMAQPEATQHIVAQALALLNTK